MKRSLAPADLDAPVNDVASSASRAAHNMKQPLFAKLSPVIAHAPQLFQGLPKGAEPTYRRLEYVVGELTFTFVGPQLGAVELRVLQGLVGLAGGRGASRPARGTALREDVEALLEQQIVITTSYNDLARTIGYCTDSGSAHRSIREALEKLFTLAVFVGPTSNRRSQDFAAGHLFSRLASRDAGCTLSIEMCPVLASAVLGGPGEYLRVSLDEVRQLKTDVARLLHHRLHWINTGHQREVGLDKLVGYVWPEPACGVTQRKRRERVREALNELESLGWRVTHCDNVYRIGRPAGTVTPSLPKRSHRPAASVTPLQ